MQVRRLTSDDAATWRAMRLDAIRDYPAAFLTSYDEAAAVPLDRTAQWLETGHTYGPVVQGDLVGAGTFSRYQRAQMQHRGSIGPFFIQPDMRGRGAADALMKGLVAAARDAGAWQLDLQVAESNGRAVAFYRRHGFVEAGRIPNATLLDGHLETDLLMIRTDTGAHH